VAVATVVGHTLAGRAIVVDARFVPPAACRPAPASLARYLHIPRNATVADAAARRERAFFARPFFAAAAPSTAAGARRVCARAFARFLTRFVGPFWGDNPLPPRPVSRVGLTFPLPPPLLWWPRLPRQCALGGRPRCQREARFDAIGARELSVRQPVVWCCGRRPRAGGVSGDRAPAIWAAAARRRCGRRPRDGGVGGGRAPAVWAAAARRRCARLPLVVGVRGCCWLVVWAAAALR